VSLAAAPIACHEIDLEGKVVWVNAAECSLLGLSEADLLGRPVWEFVAPEEQDASRPAVARKLHGDERLASFERTLVRPDGSRLAIEIHENYLRDKNGAIAGIRSFLIDITERRRAVEALRRVQENRELRIPESTQELAGGVAREFNNLLTSIMGYASLAATDMVEGSRERKNIDQVLAAARSAADLTQQILAYSGRGKFVLEELDVGKLIEGTARLLDSMAGEKGTLRRNLAAALPHIEADSGQVRQVVINLTANAADALGDRGGEIEISTGVMWAERDELPSLQAGRVLSAGLYVYIEVCDTGGGMDAETQTRIFDPFFSTKFTGRGLGLSAVLGIMRGHRGSIQVTSKPGEGTIFRVLFPAKEEWRETEASEPEHEAPG
jgi:two-component system cell cycle sensor histidine kinase/response regulator CckA